MQDRVFRRKARREHRAVSDALEIGQHVFEPLAHLGSGAAGGDLRALRDKARRELEDILCKPLKERGLDCETRLLEGTPAEALFDAAEEAQADLIVVGAHRLGRLKELLLGSTSQALAERARRPVAIVPLP